MTSQPQGEFDWTEADRRAADLIRVAGIALGWREFTGEAGESVSLEHFGASAAGPTLYEKFGFTAERVAAAARSSIARAISSEGQRTS